MLGGSTLCSSSRWQLYRVLCTSEANSVHTICPKSPQICMMGLRSGSLVAGSPTNSWNIYSNTHFHKNNGNMPETWDPSVSDVCGCFCFSVQSALLLFPVSWAEASDVWAESGWLMCITDKQGLGLQWQLVIFSFFLRSDMFNQQQFQ